MSEKVRVNCKHNSNDHIYTNVQKNAIIYNMLFIKILRVKNDHRSVFFPIA